MPQLPIKALASYALFSTMYNNGHKNAYDMIAAFIDDVIKRKHLVSFTVSDIVDLLEQEFYLYIPFSVAKSSIERLKYIEKERVYKTDFSVCEKLIKDVRFNEQEIVKEYVELENDLINYALGQKHVDFNLSHKESLINAFIEFMLNGEKSSPWSAIIASYIIEREGNGAFEKKLRNISEGLILYAGIAYSSNAAPRHSWHKLKIFLETEILFNITGLNGLIFKDITKELVELFNELNKRNASRIIELHYFDESKQQIDNYFKQAEMYVRTGKALTVEDSRKAMRYIVNGCHQVSDVIEKKTLFFQELNKLNITPFTFDPYSQDNNRYNLEDQELLSRYGIEDDEYKYIKHINYINILRRNEQPKDIADAGNILLTGTAKILRISHGESKYANAPLAVGIGTLTNKLWYDLQKEFTHDIPKAFDMIIRAKVALSSILGDSLQDKYNQVLEDYKKGEYTQEDFMAFRSEIIDACKRPDDIEIDKLDDVMEDIYNKDIDKYRLERDKLREENIKLKFLSEKESEGKSEVNRELQAQIKESLKIYNEKKKYLCKNIGEIEYKRQKSKLLLGRTMKSVDIFLLILVVIIITLVAVFSGVINDMHEKIVTGFSTTVILWFLKNNFSGLRRIKRIDKIIIWVLEWRNNLRKFVRNYIYKRNRVDIIELRKLRIELKDAEKNILQKNHLIDGARG